MMNFLLVKVVVLSLSTLSLVVESCKNKTQMTSTLEPGVDVKFTVWGRKECANNNFSIVYSVSWSLTVDSLTTTSDSGVCFYGETAKRVLDILATGKYRSISPSVRRPKDCSDLEPNRDTSGVYTIYPTRGRGVKVYCDMKTDGGRWTVLVRRMDGSQDFNKKWIEYENGFGNLDKEFWLGNRYLHTLTSIGKTEMRVDMQNFKGDRKFAKYTTFKVGDALSKYKLTIGGFTGNVPDAFAAGNHNGQRFTTSDNDNDKDSTNCSTQLKRDGGGWWFNRCEMVCFTFSYANNKKGITDNDLIQWENWKGSRYSLKYASMMIRRV